MAVVDIAFLIRLCYDETKSDEEVDWRFSFFEHEVLPRIRAQIECPKFDVWVWIHPRHKKRVEAMGVHTFTVPGATRLEGTHQLGTVRGLPRFGVQVRLDSDDLIVPLYLNRALQELDKIDRRQRGLVQFQPMKVQLDTGKTYMCYPGSGRGHYGPRKISAFCVLRQPMNMGLRYSWVYGVGHTELWRYADRVAMISETGWCYATCHRYNDSTQVYEWDEEIGSLSI
jgi:hypothetical protein